VAGSKHNLSARVRYFANIIFYSTNSTATYTAMADSGAPVKKAAAKKPKAVASHPTYVEMVKAAINSTKVGKTGVSRQAIVKYITANYKVGDNCHTALKLALKRGVKSGVLDQPKGSGASGSFKIAKKAEKPAAKKPVAKKPAKAKKSTPKKPKATKAKPKAKKPATKKVKAGTPKKPAAKKPAAKKPAAKKPAAKKPAAKKPAAKKPAAKKPAKKPAAAKPAAKKAPAKKAAPKKA